MMPRVAMVELPVYDMQADPVFSRRADDVIHTYREKYPNCEVAVLKRQHSDVEHNMNGVDLYLSCLPLSDGLENVTLIEDGPYCVTFHRSLAERIYGNRWTETEVRRGYRLHAGSAELSHSCQQLQDKAVYQLREGKASAHGRALFHRGMQALLRQSS